MRNPLLFPTILLITGVACHQSSTHLGPFRNVDKWIIQGGTDLRQLRDRPKEVTEYNYVEADTDKPEKWKKLYLKYSFNADGDVISIDTYINDIITTTRASRFDSNGYQSTRTNVKKGVSMTIMTRPLGDGRYKMVVYQPQGKSISTISSFTADGKEVIRDNFEDTAAQEKSQHAELWYDGAKVTRMTVISKESHVDEYFYYSRWETPDSILAYTIGLLGKKLEARDYYAINDHGDPVRFVAILGNDTAGIQLFQYVYDRQGNWTRKIHTTLANTNRKSYVYDPNKTVMVTDRVYVY